MEGTRTAYSITSHMADVQCGAPESDAPRSYRRTVVNRLSLVVAGTSRRVRALILFIERRAGTTGGSVEEVPRAEGTLVMSFSRTMLRCGLSPRRRCETHRGERGNKDEL